MRTAFLTARFARVAADGRAARVALVAAFRTARFALSTRVGFTALRRFRPAFVAAFLTALVALRTFFFALFSAFFSTRTIARFVFLTVLLVIRFTFALRRAGLALRAGDLDVTSLQEHAESLRRMREGA